MKNTLTFRKIFSLLLALAMLLASHPVAFANEQSATPDAFHVPTLLQMIENNLATGNTDEEFFHAIANAYLADPRLFADMIAGFSSEEVEFLAKGIGYDLQKTGRADLAEASVNCETQAATAIARLIYTQVHNAENASLSVFASPEELEMIDITNPDAELLYFDDITVSTPTLTQTEADVLDTVNVTVGIGTYTGQPTARKFSVTLYKSDGTTTSTVKVMMVSLPAYATTASVTFFAVFNDTGVYTLYAELKDLSGSVLDTSSNSSSITIWGYWRITVELPENRNLFGTLSLYDASGALICSDICLGRSESGADPSVYKGNTPTGECTGELDGPVSNTSSYGPHKRIVLYPKSGQIKELEDAGIRDDFLIHGGNPPAESSVMYPLRVTYGCIRITNAYQLTLQTEIEAMIDDYHYVVGYVSITEYSTATE